MSETLNLIGYPNEFLDQPPLSLGEIVTENYSTLISQGLELSKSFGFSIDESLKAIGVQPEEIESKKNEVIDKTIELATWMEIDEIFFNRPANVVLLAGIADSLIKVDDSNVSESKKDIQRVALQDIVSMLVGNSSGRLRREGVDDPWKRDRYIESHDTSEGMEIEEYYESITNHELTLRIDALLRDSGPNSFLASQREQLGITFDNEAPFTVRVLSAGDSGDMYVAHTQKKPNFPEWKSDMTDEERVMFNKASDEASAIYELNRAEVQKLEKNLEEYEARFMETQGPFITAAVVKNKKKGLNELTLRAPQAMSILRYYQNGEGLPDDKSVADDIEKGAAIIRHEYAHTQKELTIGAHTQLGLIVEERKAELVSADKQGYQDVKYLFMDVGRVVGTSIGTILKESLKEDDSLSSFVCKTASVAGLRNTILLMSLKPLPYDKFPEYASKFADVAGAFGVEGDQSSMEIPVRETVELMGDEKLKLSLKEWAEALPDHLLDTAVNFMPHYRRRHGHGFTAPYHQRAVLDEIKRRGLDITITSEFK